MSNPKEEAYDEHIAPLMTRIIKFCKKYQIPMIATFELDQEKGHAEDDPLMCTTILEGHDWEFKNPNAKKAAKLIEPARSPVMAFTIMTPEQE